MRALLLAVFLLTASAHAATLRWANDGDVNSLDPYTRSETFLLTFDANIYEPLVRRDRAMKVEPALATSWEQPTPTTWRFHLRPGVHFSGGEAFTADDVVFSYARATGPGSNVQSFFQAVAGVRKLDDLTVEFETRVPDPIFLEEIPYWGIMSHAWCEAHDASQVADLGKQAENYATRHADGTGPFVLDVREPDRRTTLNANPAWWDKPEHNLTHVEFDVIGNAATRVAALLSGDIDMIYTVPPQDAARIAGTDGLRLIQGPELRTIFLGMDQSRDRLLKSDVAGPNPFKDRRVRQAFAEAIDTDAIHARVMRGQSHPTGLLYGPGINGYSAATDIRAPHDVPHAKELLAEAGFPAGFGVTLDCPNDRYVNDEAICQAVAAMLARIGVRVTVNAQTRVLYFAQIGAPNYSTSFYLLGWTPTTRDAHNALFNLAGTRGGRRGVFNAGGYSNPALDTLLDRISVDTDQADRDALIAQASALIHEDAGFIPLHQQQLVWAARTSVALQQMPDNAFPLRYVVVK